MDFLKKVMPLKSTSTLIATTKYFKVYHEHDTTNPTTKFIYNETSTGQNAIKYLKQLKHPNILSILKSKEHKNNTYIKSILLFSIKDVWTASIEYQHYVISTLADVIEFLNKCGLCHNSIEMDNLYCNSMGNLVVAGFDLSKQECNQNDEYMFFEMMKLVDIDVCRTNKTKNKMHRFKVPSYDSEPDSKDDKKKGVDIDYSMCGDNNELSKIFKSYRYESIRDFIELNKISQTNNIYTKLDHSFLKFILFSLDNKIKFVDFITQNSAKWIDITKRYIINFFISEITSKHQKYKIKILVMIFSMKLDDIGIFIEKLFSLPDSLVRLFLLHNIDFYIEKVEDWNKKIFENLIIGLKCNDASLQLESIKFINRIANKLNNGNIKSTIKSLEYGSTNCDIINEGIKFIDVLTAKIKKDQSLVEAVYKIIFIFLNNSTTRGQVLCLLKRMYDCFDIRKLHEQILPALCNYLCDVSNQDLCFDLTEEILRFLKKNKSKIIKGDWGVKKLGNVMSKVSLKMPSFMSKNEIKNKDASEKKWEEDNEWNDSF